MNSSTYRVRRAVVDDLGILKPAWEAMRYPVAELEKHLTEFQIAENQAGKVVGGVCFQMFERHGWIHSEAYPDFAIADAARPLLWERIQNLSSNHGIVRLWTTENAPFWKQQKLEPTNAETLKKLPATWAGAGSEWLTLQLKDEESIVSLEKELAMFMQAERARTERTFQQARVIKYIATGLAVMFAIFVAVAVFWMLKKNPSILNRFR